MKIGEKYNHLTCISEVIKKDKYYNKYYLFKCDCGNEKIICGKSVINGKTTSCGCYLKQLMSIIGKKSRKHGYGGKRLFHIYETMKQRCNKPKAINYYMYGGRGIKVCKEWENNPSSFIKWALENGYADNLTIDRIDSNGNYEPQNCRWVTHKEQANNRRINVFIDDNGNKITITNYMQKYKISKGRAYGMLKRGEIKRYEER